METFLSKALMPVFLIGCLTYVFYEYDAEPDQAEEIAAPLELGPVIVTARDDAVLEPGAEEEEPRFHFADYPCGDDCSEHLAGYDWAHDSGISDPDNCEGRSAPFIEGCRVFVEQREFNVAMRN